MTTVFYIFAVTCASAFILACVRAVVRADKQADERARKLVKGLVVGFLVLNFSRDASAGHSTMSQKNSQTRKGVAATASEGTACKLVDVNDRTQRYIEFKGDNRKDGSGLGVDSGAAQFNLLDRLSWLESRDNDASVGDRGRSRGRFQLSEAAWIDTMALRRSQGLPEYDWECAHSNEIAREVACQYLGILHSQLSLRLSRPPTESELLRAYRTGVTGFFRRGRFNNRKK